MSSSIGQSLISQSFDNEVYAEKIKEFLKKENEGI